jgi:uncharacterized RDD family membrane protein YckC
MYCRNCGKEINDQAVICVHCGLKSDTGTKHCQNCGAEVGSNAEICIKCGVQLQGARSFVSTGVQYAGFWKRFVAILIDGILLNIAGFIFAKTFPLRFVSGLLGIVISWLYFALMESSFYQATLGKQVLGIIVTDIQGNRISLSQATVRHFAKIISTITLLIGYIMAGFTEKKQALHDIIANCLVIRKPVNNI